ncbi:6-bladed beta-propeller [Puteibacter caeruleilacunae]|nr:6-bladed beta-propeller [Puteibacter caeruleilacunae]
MKSSLVLLIMLLSVFFVCCRNSTDEEISKLKVIKVFDSQNKALRFSSIELLPLQTLDSVYLGDQLALEEYKGDLFILDRIRGTVYRFSEKGEYVNNIGRLGKGPEEFLGIRDFLIYNDTVEILSGLGKYSTISKYHKNGEFIGKKKYDYVAMAFDRLENKYFFYMSYNRFHKFRIEVLDLKGDVLESYFRNKSSVLTVDEDVFRRNGTELFFAESFNNVLYDYKDGKMIPKMKLDYGSLNIPRKFFELDGTKGFELITKHGFGNVTDYMKTSKLTFINSVIQSTKETYLRQMIIDKNGIVKEKDVKSEKEYYFRYPQLMKNDQLVYLMYPNYIIQNKEKFLELPIANPEVLEEISEFDNPIIAYCKIK